MWVLWEARQASQAAFDYTLTVSHLWIQGAVQGSKSKCGSESLQDLEERMKIVSLMFWITQPYKQLCRIGSAQHFTALKEK